MQCILKFNEVSVFAQLNCFQIQVKILVVGCCCGQEVAALLCGYFLPGVMCVHLINFNSLKMFGRSSGHTHPGKKGTVAIHQICTFTVGTSGKFKMSRRKTDRPTFESNMLGVGGFGWNGWFGWCVMIN